MLASAGATGDRAPREPRARRRPSHLARPPRGPPPGGLSPPETHRQRRTQHHEGGAPPVTDRQSCTPDQEERVRRLLADARHTEPMPRRGRRPARRRPGRAGGRSSRRATRPASPRPTPRRHGRRAGGPPPAAAGSASAAGRRRRRDRDRRGVGPSAHAASWARRRPTTPAATVSPAGPPATQVDAAERCRDAAGGWRRRGQPRPDPAAPPTRRPARCLRCAADRVRALRTPRRLAEARRGRARRRQRRRLPGRLLRCRGLGRGRGRRPGAVRREARRAGLPRPGRRTASVVDLLPVRRGPAWCAAPAALP